MADTTRVDGRPPVVQYAPAERIWPYVCSRRTAAEIHGPFIGSRIYQLE
jgi:hypothetical protein